MSIILINPHPHAYIFISYTDVDECAAPQLNSCSPHAYCTNTVESYTCTCHPGYHDLNPSQPGTVCMGKKG